MDVTHSNISTDSEDDDDELLARINLVVMNELLATSPLLKAFPELLGKESSAMTTHCSDKIPSEHNIEEPEQDSSNGDPLKNKEPISEEHLEEMEEDYTNDDDSVSDASQLEETTSEKQLGEFEVVSVKKTDYFEENIPGFALNDFEVHFGMSRTSFANLMERLAVNGSVVRFQKKLLFTLWILRNEESFSSLTWRFHMSKSSGHKSYCDVLDILCAHIGSFIQWPTTSQYRTISRAFEEKTAWYIPGILGVIGSCHIRIRKPLENGSIYFDRKKKRHSVILQGVCDHRGVFLNVHVGLPGGVQEVVAFQKNPLSARLDSLIPVKCHLIGGLGYPLSKRLVTPFAENNRLTEKERHFNSQLNNARMTIRRAFSLLKNRFRRLKYLDVCEPVMANKVVSACCVLYNHIQSRCEDFYEVIEIDDDELLPSKDSSSTEDDHTSVGSLGKRNHLLSLF